MQGLKRTFKIIFNFLCISIISIKIYLIWFPLFLHYFFRLTIQYSSLLGLVFQRCNLISDYFPFQVTKVDLEIIFSAIFFNVCLLTSNLISKQFLMSGIFLQQLKWKGNRFLVIRDDGIWSRCCEYKSESSNSLIWTFDWQFINKWPINGCLLDHCDNYRCWI